MNFQKKLKCHLGQKMRKREGGGESILSEFILDDISFFIWTFQCRWFIVILINNNYNHTSMLQRFLTSDLIILMIRKPIFCFEISNHLPPPSKKKKNYTCKWLSKYKYLIFSNTIKKKLPLTGLEDQLFLRKKHVDKHFQLLKEITY